MKYLYRLCETRVRRTYRGGKMLDAFLQNEAPCDNACPEDWVISTVTATNVPPIAGEGLTAVEGRGGGRMLLKDMLVGRKKELLGRGLDDVGILVKLIDSAERLSIQVHPSIENARRYFNSEHGKTECWYILGKRSEEACIYIGFREGVTKEKWARLFDEGDTAGMLGCLHKVNVSVGDCFFVRGGVPHAIGKDCFLAEIQEPTDYTLRSEKYKADGSRIDDLLITQGIGEENMLDCFAYDGLTYEDMLKCCALTPQEKKRRESSACYSLVDSSVTDLFCMDILEIDDAFDFCMDRYYVMIVVSGVGQISCSGETAEIKQGDKFFVGASCEKICLQGKELKILVCYE